MTFIRKYRVPIAWVAIVAMILSVAYGLFTGLLAG